MGKGSLLERLGFRRSFPTLEDFRTRVAEAIEAADPTTRVERVGEESLETHFLDSAKPGLTHLARAYDWCREHPRDLEFTIEQMARLAVKEPATATPENLIVLVRPNTFDPGTDGNRPALARPLIADLVAVVALDTPDSYVISPAAALREELDLDDASIWSRAIANTRKAIAYEPAPVEPGKIGEIVTGVRLAASLLADDAVWDSPEMTACGPLLVAPIERDRVVFTALADAEAATALRDWHARQPRTADWLADLLIVRRDQRWHVAD